MKKTYIYANETQMTLLKLKKTFEKLDLKFKCIVYLKLVQLVKLLVLGLKISVPYVTLGTNRYPIYM